jgi:hypothetical protein
MSKFRLDIIFISVRWPIWAGAWLRRRAPRCDSYGREGHTSLTRAGATSSFGDGFRRNESVCSVPRDDERSVLEGTLSSRTTDSDPRLSPPAVSSVQRDRRGDYSGTSCTASLYGLGGSRTGTPDHIRGTCTREARGVLRRAGVDRVTGCSVRTYVRYASCLFGQHHLSFAPNLSSRGVWSSASGGTIGSRV